MEQTYIILWKARNSGRTGQGKKLLNIQEANTLAAELNHEYPEYEHLVLNTADSLAKPTPPVLHLIGAQLAAQSVDGSADSALSKFQAEPTECDNNPLPATPAIQKAA